MRNAVRRVLVIRCPLGRLVIQVELVAHARGEQVLAVAVEEGRVHRAGKRKPRERATGSLRAGRCLDLAPIPELNAAIEATGGKEVLLGRGHVDGVHLLLVELALPPRSRVAAPDVEELDEALRVACPEIVRPIHRHAPALEPSVLLVRALVHVREGLLLQVHHTHVAVVGPAIQLRAILGVLKARNRSAVGLVVDDTVVLLVLRNVGRGVPNPEVARLVARGNHDGAGGWMDRQAVYSLLGHLADRGLVIDAQLRESLRNRHCVLRHGRLLAFPAFLLGRLGKLSQRLQELRAVLRRRIRGGQRERTIWDALRARLHNWRAQLLPDLPGLFLAHVLDSYCHHASRPHSVDHVASGLLATVPCGAPQHLSNVL
eukprot:scaffold613_cov243-Pinguiococcus_pyrenoidosus.AAC.22